VFYLLELVKTEYLTQDLSGQVLYIQDLHEIDGYGRATDLLQGLCHQATFAKPAGRYQDQVILAIKHLLDLFQFVHAVREEFIFYDCAKFKRIHNRSSAKSYIAKNLVAKNFASFNNIT
jgi:hypothetical protein